MDRRKFGCFDSGKHFGKGSRRFSRLGAIFLRGIEILGSTNVYVLMPRQPEQSAPFCAKSSLKYYFNASILPELGRPDFPSRLASTWGSFQIMSSGGRSDE